MKRLLGAAALALIVHGIVLSLSFNGLEKKPAISLPAQQVTISLTYRQPQQDKIDPEKPLQKSVKKKAEAPKRILPREEKPTPDRAKPVKKVEPRLSSPVEKTVSEPLPPEPRLETSHADEQGEKLEGESQPEKNEPAAEKADGARAEAAAIVREARPLYRMNPPPRYPRIARERGYQGTVLLDVFVNSRGRVEDLRVHNSSGYQVLDEAAVSAVREWTFEPGRRGEQKVAMWVKVPVRFELE